MRAPLHESVLVVGMTAGLGLAACGDARPDDKLQNIPPPPVAKLAPADVALKGANIPTLDPAPMAAAEIAKVIGRTPRCEFSYTRAGDPVLAFARGAEAGADGGVVKLNGQLIALRRGQPTEEQSFRLDTDTLAFTIAGADGPLTEQPSGAERVEARMVFDLSRPPGLHVGYGGYLGCTTGPVR
jgi:hypothetical protein